MTEVTELDLHLLEGEKPAHCRRQWQYSAKCQMSCRRRVWWIPPYFLSQRQKGLRPLPHLWLAAHRNLQSSVAVSFKVSAWWTTFQLVSINGGRFSVCVNSVNTKSLGKSPWRRHSFHHAPHSPQESTHD